MNAQKSFKNGFGFWLIFKYPLSMWCNYNWLKILVITFVFDAKIFCIHHLMNEPINWILWWKWQFNIFESFLCSFLRADIYFLKNCFHWSNFFFYYIGFTWWELEIKICKILFYWLPFKLHLTRSYVISSMSIIKTFKMHAHVAC